MCGRLSAGACIVVVSCLCACSGGAKGRLSAGYGPLVGDCAEPNGQGRVSASPRLVRADRDLDGDGRPEIVVSDQKLCTEDKNCYWNLFATDSTRGCKQFLGTVAGNKIELLATRSPDAYRDIRAWWRFKTGNRYLLQHYRYHRVGYQLQDTLLCSRTADRFVCVPEGR